MTEMTVSETLNRAADLIEERGWTTGLDAMSADSNAPLCLEGALSAVLDAGVRPDNRERLNYPNAGCPAYRAVADYLALDLTRLFMWNDNQLCATPVIEALRACAVIEASRERQPAQVSS